MRRMLFLVAAIPLLWGCTSSQDPPVVEAKDKPVERKVETYTVTSQEVQGAIEATGSIQADIEGSARIMSALPGTVERIVVKVGEHVKKGAPLAAIRSSDVSDAFSSYLSALSQHNQAERVYNLNRQLFEIGAVTKNEFLNSEANREQARALVQGAKRKLEIYGVNADTGFTDTHIIRSPMSGVVIEVQAHVGDRVDTSSPIMDLGDPGKVMVVANIYDTAIHNIHAGQELHFSADIFPQRTFDGVVTYISDASDPDAKTVKTYIRMRGDVQGFKQNTFLRMKILNGKKVCPVIPKTALLYKDGKFTVYLSVGGKYELKEVKTAYEVSDKLVAVEGLKAGDEIVLSAIGLEKT